MAPSLAASRGSQISLRIGVHYQHDAAKSLRRVRDYDNIETIQYLDVIKALFLSNDSGLSISVFRCTELNAKQILRFST